MDVPSGGPQPRGTPQPGTAPAQGGTPHPAPCLPRSLCLAGGGQATSALPLGTLASPRTWPSCGTDPWQVSSVTGGGTLPGSHREGADRDTGVSGGSWCPRAEAQGTPSAAGITPPSHTRAQGGRGWGQVSLTVPHAPPQTCPPLLPIPARCASSPPYFLRHLSKKRHGSASHCREPEGRWDPPPVPAPQQGSSLHPLLSPRRRRGPWLLRPPRSGPSASSPQLQPSAPG